MELTEGFRKEAVKHINSQVESNSEESERQRLEAQYGQVWDTQQLQEDFSVSSFLAPYVAVTRKSDGKKGMLEFQHNPRFYFNFR